jgi:RHS repeat-associated protein
MKALLAGVIAVAPTLGRTCPIKGDGSPDCGGGGPASVSSAGPSTAAGNPINLISGNKYQEETDLPALPGVLGLELKRYYNSMSDHAGLFGKGWRMSYETVLYDLGSQIQIVQADGRRMMFQRGTGQGNTLCTGALLGDGQVRIEEPTDGRGARTYHWRWPDGRTLMFTAGSGGGHPLHAITAPGGQRVSLTYAPTGELAQIRDPQGRKLTLIYSNEVHGRSRTLRAIDTPLGRINYVHDGLARLTEVSRSKDQSAPTPVRLYHYEDGHNGGRKTALTGMSVRSIDTATGKPVQQRLSTYGYNAAGQAILSTRGDPKEMKDGKPVAGTGIEQVELQYVERALPAEGRPDRVTGEVQPRQFGRSVLTNSLGQKTDVLFAVIGGNYRLIEMRGPGCSTCARSNMRYAYDIHGQLVRETRLDDEGRPVDSVKNQYDRYGRLIRVDREVHAKTGNERQGSEPVQWLRRFEYADVHYEDGSVAVAQRPSLIAQPSVVSGNEFITRIEHGPAGGPTAQLPVKITQIGWEPATAPGVTPVSIERSIAYRYVGDGPSAGQLREMDGPLPGAQDQTRFTYSPHGERNTRGELIPAGLLLSVAHPEGLTEKLEYDDLGRVVTHTPIDGVPVRYTYDDTKDVRSLRVAITTRAGLRTSTIYDHNGRVAMSQGADGLGVAFGYNVAGRVSELRDSNGYRIAMHYDAEGNPLDQQWFEPNAAQPLRAHYRRYDGHGRLTMNVRADEWVDEYEYHGHASDPIKSVDGLLNTTHWLPHATRHARAAVRIGFDGELTAALDNEAHPPAGRLVRSLSDDFGRVVWISLADHGQRWARYDEASRLVEARHADGTLVRYVRDGLGRLIKKDTVEPTATDTVTLRYFGSQLVEVNDAAQRSEFRYDEAGRLAERRVTIHAVDAAKAAGTRSPGTYSVRYAYDPTTGRRVGQQLADGRTLFTDFDAKTGAPSAVRLSANNLIDRLVSLWGGKTGTRLVSGIELHPFNGVIAAIAGNGVRTERAYDIAGRLTKISIEGVTQLGYKYGAGNQIRAQRQEWMRPLDAQGAINASYRYGSRGQWHDSGQGTEQGPRMVKTFNTPVGSAEGDVRVDLRGQIVADGSRRYRYDGQGRLVQVSEASADPSAMREIARYTYNAWGERVAKVAFEGGRAIACYFLYEGQRIAAEIDESGSITSQYLYLNGTPYAKLESESPTNKERTLYIHTDARGMPLAMTDERKNIVWRSGDKLGDQAWGRMTAIHAPEQRASVWERSMHTLSFGRWGAQPHDGAKLNLRLPGQYFDAETGLHYNYQRYYDPKTHRYISPDPVGYKDGLDPYLYTAGDPINKVDPFGLYQIDVHYYLTFFLAVVAGVDTEEARTMALAAQYIDENPMTRPMKPGMAVGDMWDSIWINKPALVRYHFTQEDHDPPRTATEAAFHLVTGGDLGSYTKRRVASPDNPQLQRLLGASNKAPTRCARLQLFGEYLHTFEDTFAHRDRDNNPYSATVMGLGLGHGFGGENPDYTYNHWSPVGYWGENYDRTIQMEKEVLAKMSAFSNPKNHKLSWKTIEYTMEQFTKFEATADSSGFSEKIQILNDALKAHKFDVDLSPKGEHAFKKALAERNRDKFLMTLDPEEYVGTILPRGTAPLPKS